MYITKCYYILLYIITYYYILIIYYSILCYYILLYITIHYVLLYINKSILFYITRYYYKYYIVLYFIIWILYMIVLLATDQLKHINRCQDTYSEQVLRLWHSSTMSLLDWKLFHDARFEHIPPGLHASKKNGSSWFTEKWGVYIYIYNRIRKCNFR